MKRFVLGDIHGEIDYLKQVLERSGFNYKEDLLIQIGDICDRGWGVFEAMDELLKIKNLVLIAGNHDLNFIEYMRSNRDFLGSYAANGTHTTVTKWKELDEGSKHHYKVMIFDRMRSYYITDDNIMFTHGGFPRMERLDDVDDNTFAWDRELVQEAMKAGKEKLPTLYNFKKIFIGHTPTIYWGKTEPIYSGGIWNIDTGSGKGGPLTIMDIDTEQYWQSDHKFNPKDYGFIEETKEETGEIPEKKVE